MRGDVAIFLLLYISVIFTLRVEKVKFPLLLFSSSVFCVSHINSHLSLYSTKTSYYLYIFKPFWYCTKNGIALYKLVWNTRKSI